MSDFLKTNRLFVGGLVIVAILSLLLVYFLGFRAMLSQIASQPERLRDITFYIWDNYPFAKHGYLVFISINDFEKGIAYSHHSSFYLMLMYVLYKVEVFCPALPMRATVAVLNVLALVAVIIYIAASQENRRIGFRQGILFLFSIAFTITMPGYWISAGRFNVDNSIPLIISALMLVAYWVDRDEPFWPKLWLSVFLFGIFAPISAVLFGAFLVLLAFREEGADKKLMTLAVGIMFIGVIAYMQPAIVSKVLGFKASNSGWLFRSGLDGDRSYFSNIWESVFSPHFPRPPHLLLVPIALLLVQMRAIAAKLGVANSLSGSSGTTAGVFYSILFSQYILTCLFWPQAVSIHPYLYDYLALAPICVWITFNFLESKALHDGWRLWVVVLMFLISFNLQQIAQAKCVGCYYPSWTGNQLKLQ